MKKQLSLFVWAVAVFGMGPVMAASSSADVVYTPRGRTTTNYEKYETRTSTRTYAPQQNRGSYYTAQPQGRSAQYQNYQGGTTRYETARTTKTETVRGAAKRKYFLAHPFFQPLKGKFGSVTDFSYSTNSYDINLTPTPAFAALSDTDAAWDMKRFAIKEDFSYGISDRFAILGMLQYDSSKYTMDWSVAPDDTMKDSGLNLFGLGAQWRFMDDSQWIATLSGYFQHQKDIANNFIVDLKAGYKIGTTTIYGLARGWMVDFDGNSYGNGITNGNGTSMFIAYKTDVSSEFYIEGGAGVFTVVDEDWTLNLEAILGNYGWHNQASIKGAIGWQPGESFALNLYAKAAIYDSADDKNLGFWWLEPAAGVNTFTYAGNANISNYSEMSVGLQAILYF